MSQALEPGPQALADAQQQVRRRLLEVLSADPRVEGAWLSGSFGRGEGDIWADFDLHVAIRDEACEEFLAERPQLYAAIGTPVLVQPEFPANPPIEGGRFQLVYFDGPIEVDWSIGPASKAQKPVACEVLFERRTFPTMEAPSLTAAERHERAQWWTTFFWAMAPIALKYTARGTTRQGASQTDLLCRGLICLKRLLADAAGPNPWLSATNRVVEPEIDKWLPRTGPEITPVSLLGTIYELIDAMKSLEDELSKLGVDTHPELAAQTHAMAWRVADVVGLGQFEKRKYR